MGNRFDITGDKFSEAINKIFIVYHDSEAVLLAIKSFHESVIRKNQEPSITNQKLMELFKTMCSDLDIDTSILTDDFYLQAFNNR